MSTHNMLQVDNDSVEYGTPDNILYLVHQLLGYISLDPASNPEWNKRVGAEKIYTAKDNGLLQRWYGNVWLNHPFRKTERVCAIDCKKQICQKRGHHLSQDILGNEYWIAKFISEYETGNVSNALNICYASTSEKWYKPLLKYPTCFINVDGRTNYIDQNGEIVKGVQKGSSVTYLGKKVGDFADLFSTVGDVMFPSKNILRLSNGGNRKNW